MALYDSDMNYSKRFLEYFKNQENLLFEIMVFTRKESLQEFLGYQAVEILLAGEGNLPEDLQKDNIKYVFNLTDKKLEEPDAVIPAIHKYQAAKKVMSDILSNYTRLENTIVSAELGGNIILSVFDPLSGMEGFSFARSMAVSMSEQSKVLFLPLTLLPVQHMNRNLSQEQSLSEFIFYLKENHPELMNKFKPLIKYDGTLSCLTGLAHGFDLLALNQEDAKHWVTFLKEKSGYDTVVIYLGFYSEASVEILRLSSSVYIPVSDDPYQLEVIKEWERQMKEMGIDITTPQFRRMPADKVKIGLQP
jgi:hypothetical protein